VIERPHVIIIGAMKCATSTLHDQLAAQPGIFMSTPKEPNFFSDDGVHAKGLAWYESLFDDAASTDLCGESSTHYTKRPTLPKTIERLREVCPADTRFIYIMRHPVDRLVSHYMHEWSQGVIRSSIDSAVDEHAGLIEYGRYAYQLAPWVEAFGQSRIMPMFFERLVAEPQVTLEQVATFIGHAGMVKWDETCGQRNASSQRLRKSAVRDLIVDNAIARRVRRMIVPVAFRDRIKRLWTMHERPELNAGVRTRLEAIFDEDLAELGAWFDLPLSCGTFTDIARTCTPRWTAVAREMVA